MRFGPIALVLTVVLVAGRCGGEDGVSKADFVAQADGICKRYDEKLAALGEAKDLREAARIAERAVPLIRDGVARLRALQPPDELRALAERWYAVNAKNVELAERLRDAAKRGDLAAAQRTVRETRANERKADGLARKLGLEECAKDE